eukprot:gene2426-2049_t
MEVRLTSIHGIHAQPALARLALHYAMLLPYYDCLKEVESFLPICEQLMVEKQDTHSPDTATPLATICFYLMHSDKLSNSIESICEDWLSRALKSASTYLVTDTEHLAVILDCVAYLDGRLK